MDIITVAAVKRTVAFCIGVAAYKLIPYVEAYFEQRGHPDTKPYCPKVTALRKAATDFIEAKVTRGGIWKGVQIADLRKISHLTDPRNLFVIDGAEGTKMLDGVDKNAEMGVEQDQNMLDQFLRARVNFESYLLLLIRFDATAATGSSHGASILHELIHHAEFLDGQFEVPGYRDNHSLRERNTAYFDAILLHLEKVNDMVKAGGPLGQPNEAVFNADDFEMLKEFGDLLKEMIRLENGEAAVRYTRNKQRIKPDLAFLKRAFGCDMSYQRVFKTLVDGQLGERARQAAILMSEIAYFEHKYWQGLNEIEDFIRAHPRDFPTEESRTEHREASQAQAAAIRDKDLAEFLKMIKDRLKDGLPRR